MARQTKLNSVSHSLLGNLSKYNSIVISFYKMLDAPPENQAVLSCCQGRHGEQQGSTLSPAVSISSCLKPGVRMKSVSDINKGSLYIF